MMSPIGDVLLTQDESHQGVVVKIIDDNEMEILDGTYVIAVDNGDIVIVRDLEDFIYVYKPKPDKRLILIL